MECGNHLHTHRRRTMFSFHYPFSEIMVKMLMAAQHFIRRLPHRLTARHAAVLIGIQNYNISSRFHLKARMSQPGYLHGRLLFLQYLFIITLFKSNYNHYKKFNICGWLICGKWKITDVVIKKGMSMAIV
jgi:hypothetical protein